MGRGKSQLFGHLSFCRQVTLIRSRVYDGDQLDQIQSFNYPLLNGTSDPLDLNATN